MFREIAEHFHVHTVCIPYRIRCDPFTAGSSLYSLLVLLLLGGELAVRLLLFYSSERDEFLVRLRVGVRVRVIGSGAVVNGKGV